MDEMNHKIQELLGLMTLKPTGWDILLSLVVAAGLTALLWGSYRLANTKDTYQPRFAATLVALALLSTMLMDLIQSNLALSLGMLGSLSIVRFRTNLQDPRDIGFVFWSMAVGLAASTGCYLLGFAGSLVVGAFMVITGRHSTPQNDMMLVIRGSEADISAVGSIVNRSCTRDQVKAKNVMADSFELVYEVRIPVEESDGMIRQLFELEGIDSVNLLAENKCA